MKFGKIVFLAAVLLVIGESAFCAHYTADKESEYSLLYESGENEGILQLLKKLGIFEGEYSAEKAMTFEKAAEIFGVEIFDENTGSDLTNEDFMYLAARSFGLKSASLEKIYDFYDFSLIKAERRYYIEGYLEKFGTPESTEEKNLIVPNKVLSEAEFFGKLSNFDVSLAEKYGYKTLSAKISDFSLSGNEKTLFLTDGTEVSVKNGAKFLIFGGRANKGNGACVFTKGDTAYAAKITRSGQTKYKTGGIYKGSVFLYDKSGGKIIFKDLKKYSASEFIKISSENSLTAFDAFSNFLVYENFSDSSHEKINRFLLDREAVFFTMKDEYGAEKICYIIYVE